MPPSRGSRRPTAAHAVILEAVEEHVAPLGGQGLQDGETNAPGRSGDQGGFSFHHLGQSSRVPCPVPNLPFKVYQCLSFHAFAFLHVRVQYAGPNIVRRPSMGEGRPGR